MNKTLLLLICVFTLNICFAQNVNRADHRTGKTMTGEMAGINSKSFYIEITSSYKSCCKDQAFLVGTGDNGNELFRTPVYSAPYLQAPRIAISSDKGIFTSARTKYIGCDYGGSRSQICKLDTTGKIIWSFTVNTEVEHLVALQDSGVGIFIADDFRKYDKNGNFVFSKLLKSGIVYGVCCLKSGNLLVSHQGTNGPALRILNMNDSTILAAAFPSFLPVIKEVDDGTIYGINNGFMMKISAALNLLIHSGGKFPANIPVKDFQFRNDSLFIIATDNLSRPNFLVVDTGFNVLHQQVSNIKAIGASGLYVGKNNFLNMITYGPYSSGYNYEGYFQTSLTGSINATYDIGVVSVIVLDSIHFPAGSNYRGNKVSADVIVKNYGNDSITDFDLNHYSVLGGTTFCLLGLQKHYNQTIPPNGMVTVNTGTFESTPVNYLVTGSYTYQLCVIATVPNGKNDLDISNDGFCRTIQMVPVGLKAENLINANFKVFPNPSHDGFTINAPAAINEVFITDISGRMIYDQENNSQELFIPSMIVAPGFYFVKIITSQGSAIKKIVVEN